MATNPQNLTVDEMGLRAEQQMRDRTIAQAMLNPNTLVTGGSTPAGQFQAMTQQNVAQNEGQAWLAEQAKRAQQDQDTARNMAETNQKRINEAFANDPRALNVQQNTIGSLYGASSGSALDAYGRRLSELSKPVDEEKIRQDAINRVQSEIDAMNRFYAEKTRQEQGEARQVGESRLGQNAAISARRGMIGSDFGAARTSTIEQANARVQNDIYELNNARRLAEQAALMGRANTAADAMIEKKQAQLNESLQAAVQLQEAQRQRAEKAADTRIAGLIAQGIEPSEADYDALAAQFGIDKETLKAKYAMSQPGAEKPIEVGGVLYQKQADGSYKPLTPGKAAEASQLMEISPGASLYDPATGEFVGTAPGRPESQRPDVTNFADGTTRQYNVTTGAWDVLAGKNTPGGTTGSTTNSNISSVTGKPLTQAERESRGFLRRLEESTGIFDSTAAGIASLSPARYAIEQSLPSGIKSDVIQRQEQAERNFITAVLREESGASINPAEFDLARKQYFPQPGDSAAVLEQKKRNRATVIEGFRLSSGEAAPSAPPSSPSSGPVGVQDVEEVIGMSLSQDKRRDVEQALREAPLLTAEEVAGLLGFNPVGGDTKPAVPVSSNNRVDKLAKAIAQHETGNRNIAGATGELATRYQFMPATWKTLAKKHLGNANAPTTDENQDMVAKAEIADLFRQGYDERQIAMIWNGGVPRRKVGTTKTTAGKTINYDTGKYADKVLAIYKNS